LFCPDHITEWASGNEGVKGKTGRQDQGFRIMLVGKAGVSAIHNGEFLNGIGCSLTGWPFHREDVVFLKVL